MPLTLGFDTSLAHVSAALVEDGRVLSAIHEDMAKGQAEHLMLMLEEILADAGKGWNDLQRIGLGIGPGNFTGIRISVAAARGLSMSLDIPAIGVSLHQALSFETQGVVRTALDARQNHVYVQDFDDMHPLAPPEIIALGDLPPGQADRIIGPAAQIARKNETIVAALHAPGAAIALFAETAEYTGPPAPLYLRATDADAPRDPGPIILDDR